MKFIKIFLIFCLLFSLKVTIAYAVNPDGVGTITLPPGIDPSPDAVSNFIPTIIKISFYVGLVASLVYMVYGGVRWIMSGGDQKALMAARETIIQAVIGVIMLSIAFAVASILNSLSAPAAAPMGTNGAACVPTNPNACRGCSMGCTPSDIGFGNYACRGCPGPF